MEKNREGNFVGGTHRACTKCGVFFEKTSKMTLCKKCNSSRVKAYTPEWRMHQRAKVRASERNLDFTIKVEDIVIPDVCPVLGITLNMNSGRSGAYDNSPSLDRTESTKGYTKDNIQVISMCANRMKGSSTNEQLHLFSQWILNHVPSKN